jgi:hypothetical protein
VKAACEEAKRAKPGEAIGIGYVAKILERWAREAADLKAGGAKNPRAPPEAKPILPVEQQVPSLAPVKRTASTDAAAAEARKVIGSLPKRMPA